jgi:hypothetical protein
LFFRATSTTIASALPPIWPAMAFTSD